MTALDHAIDNLEQLLGCFIRQQQAHDAGLVMCELWGYRDVRDGLSAETRVQGLEAHSDLAERYYAARQDAELLRGQEAQP